MIFPFRRRTLEVPITNWVIDMDKSEQVLQLKESRDSSTNDDARAEDSH